MIPGVQATYGQIRIQKRPDRHEHFSPHTDSFSQSIYTPKDFQRLYSVMSEKYTSKSFMSAVMALSDPSVRIGSNKNTSRLFNITSEDVASLAGNDYEGYVPVNGRSHWIGVRFDEQIYDLIRQTQTKSYTAQIQTGDIYIFSSGRIHETFSSFDDNDRITAGTLLAWRDDLDDVVMFS